MWLNGLNENYAQNFIIRKLFLVSSHLGQFHPVRHSD